MSLLPREVNPPLRRPTSAARWSGPVGIKDGMGRKGRRGVTHIVEIDGYRMPFSDRLPRDMARGRPEVYKKRWWEGKGGGKRKITHRGLQEDRGIMRKLRIVERTSSTLPDY